MENLVEKVEQLKQIQDSLACKYQEKETVKSPIFRDNLRMWSPFIALFLFIVYQQISADRHHKWMDAVDEKITNIQKQLVSNPYSELNM